MTSGILTSTGTYLDRIVANTLIEVEDRQRNKPDLMPYPRSPRDFVAALQRDTVALIAEVKHASPSKGVLIDPFDPVDLAKTYAANGAAALSILTDQKFFQGSLDDLRKIRAAVDQLTSPPAPLSVDGEGESGGHRLPILRKDFVVSEFQIAEARAAGADAVLLIVGVLDNALLADLFVMAGNHGLAALIEVHDEGELERALKLSPPLIGINNRDLRTFKTELATTQRLARLIPPEVTLVAESGIHSAADVVAMAAAGARAVLVGESLIVAADRGAKVRELSGVKR